MIVELDVVVKSHDLNILNRAKSIAETFVRRTLEELEEVKSVGEITWDFETLSKDRTAIRLEGKAEIDGILEDDIHKEEKIPGGVLYISIFA